MKQGPILAWHFLPHDRMTRSYDHKVDGGRKRVHEGESQLWDGPLVACKGGLHASQDLVDAVSYAPGPVCCRVRCHPPYVCEMSKLICRRREVLWMVDAEHVLHWFGLWLAEQILPKLGDPECPECKAYAHLIEEKRRWLTDPMYRASGLGSLTYPSIDWVPGSPDSHAISLTMPMIASLRGRTAGGYEMMRVAMTFGAIDRRSMEYYLVSAMEKAHTTSVEDTVGKLGLKSSIRSADNEP